MSGYKDFNRCVVCRSKYNLENYDGAFETTMLLNSLYLTVMHCIEKRDMLKTDEEFIVHWLKDRKHEVLNQCGNTFRNPKILSNLRNGLAHFNIKAFEHGGKIERIKVWVCRWSKRDNKFKEFTDDEVEKAICIFDFSEGQLRDFTYELIDHFLKNAPDQVCENCKYKEEV